MKNKKSVISDIVKKVSENENIQVIDMYSKTHSIVDTSCFYEDGIHYTPKGHTVLAHCFLQFIFAEKLKTTLVSKKLLKLSRLEFLERSYIFTKYNRLSKYDLETDTELITASKNLVKKEGYTEGLTKERFKAFKKYCKNKKKLRGKISENCLSLY